MRKFWKYLLLIAIPIVAFEVTGKIIWETSTHRGEIPDEMILFALLNFIACALCVIAFLAFIPLAIMKKWSRALGILAGLGIGVITLAVTWPSFIALGPFYP